MSTVEQSRETASLEDLLREALERPGVRELMELYECWQAAEGIASVHRQLSAVQKVVYSSDSSVGRDRG